MIREDLTEDFRALADAHTKAVDTLLEEFNDDQMLLMIETEQALNDNALKQLNVAEAGQPHPNLTDITKQRQKRASNEHFS